VKTRSLSKAHRHSVLGGTFFQRPAAKVARELLGTNLVRRRGRSLTSSMIVETEAYEGTHDLASHSSRGRTRRTEVMFGLAGHFYVYRVYGLHWMLNVVTGDIGDASAILIRGIEDVTGPGRVTAALGIDHSLNGRIAAPATGLWFEQPARTLGKAPVTRTPRIGVDYAGPVWAAKKLRFVLG
jgi:DNA-3-methyladenine glycosylase